VRAGFEQLGVARIFATCDVANRASARALEKAGLRRDEFVAAPPAAVADRELR